MKGYTILPSPEAASGSYAPFIDVNSKRFSPLTYTEALDSPTFAIHVFGKFHPNVMFLQRK